MSSQRTPRRRTSTQNAAHNDDDQENEDERIKEITQCVLAGHARKGGLKDAEVKKALKDVVRISEKQMNDVLGCKVAKDGDHLYVSYTKKLPPAAQGSVDIIADAKQGLLSIVLMFIHMSKNPLVKTDKVKEMALWEFLEELEVRQTASHPVFGIPSKLIAPSNAAEFVAAGWLSFEKKQGERNDCEEILYDWGHRAYAIINPQELLATFCEINGDKPSDWKEHRKIGKNKPEMTPIVEKKKSQRVSKRASN